ncbi:MAG TPA: alpha-L-arabinofuranosidase C-terminal domain-containing protein, partial [Candidatus Polarisedimenticolia bacterium]|nr:alpha-L-arabinofuranosidase C-terminal domain-containing protein [Candidatus Polarisedimenticolia bacterium]
DLNPKFLRFPGGNYLEGDTVETRFDWKKTIGPIDQRIGHPSPWGYRSTDGMGLMEFLRWCEDMNAEPVLAVYAGYSLKGQHVNPGPDLQPFIQDALDEIEYVSGPANSKWGAERAKDGHAKPFPLHYIEIGNEDWFDKSGSYDARFVQFSQAIRAKYPNLKLISTYDSYRPHGPNAKPDLFDDHYYRTVDEFLKDAGHYDKYDRSAPKIFVGEWAAHESSFPPWDRRSGALPPTPNMRAALGDAAWMAGLERNSDVVVMHCYAPLLVNINGRQWRPDLIGYDSMTSYGSPSYYAFRMFSTHVGDEILKGTVDNDSVFASVTRDTKKGIIYVKLVNPTADSQQLQIRIDGVDGLKGTAEAETLAADPEATNSISEPTKVVPVDTRVSDVKPSFTYTVAPSSVTVLQLHAK